MFFIQTDDDDVENISPTGSQSSTGSNSSRKPLTPISSNSIDKSTSKLKKFNFESSATATATVNNSNNGNRQSKSNVMSFSPPSNTNTNTTIKPPPIITTTTTATQNQDEPRQKLPQMPLGKFSSQIWLDFGSTSNTVNLPRSLPFKLTSSDSTNFVRVTKVPVKKGFSIDFEGVEVQKGDSYIGNVTWTPVCEGGVREVILLSLEGMGRLQITCFGFASGGSDGGGVKESGGGRSNLGKTNSEMTIRPRSKLVRKGGGGGDGKLPLPPPSSSSFSSSKITHPTLSVTTTSITPTPAPSLPIKINTTTNTTTNPINFTEENTKKTWSIKQQSSFTSWLNYLYSPSESFTHEEDLILLEQQQQQQQQQSHSSSSSQVDGNNGSDLLQGHIDRTALRSLLLHRQHSKSRLLSKKLYTSPSHTSVLQSISSEVNGGKIAVRVDRDMYADLGLRGEVVGMLMCYEEGWLRCGLEVVFGEVVGEFCERERERERSKKSTTAASTSTTKPKLSRLQTTLKKFIITRVLGDPTLLAKYTHANKKTGSKHSKLPSGRFEVTYKDSLRKAALIRILSLISFLDAGKCNGILPLSISSSSGRGCGCLFTKQSKIKSTKNMLETLCSGFLSGEGDVIKHLSSIGMKVHYTQTYLDEFDFSISTTDTDTSGDKDKDKEGDLCMDLRDGIRLVRMTELLTDNAQLTLSSSLRTPAVSRLQKLHNVTLALTSLEAHGVSLGDLKAKDVVDCNRRGVLGLLWRVIVRFKIETLLDAEGLEREVEDVRRAHKRRALVLNMNKNGNGNHNGNNYGNNNGNGSDGGKLRQRQRQSVTIAKQTDETPNGNSETDTPSSAHHHEITRLLLKWVAAVCHTFGLTVTNFTSDFADGKVLLYLLNYYHPSLVCLSDIHSTTNDIALLLTNDNDDNDDNDDDDDTRNAVYSHLLTNESKNARLSKTRISDLGGIPAMLQPFTTLNPPDEKSMVCTVAYLCSRLIESSREIQATLLIQCAMRDFLSNKTAAVKAKNARVIWKFWRERKASLWDKRRSKLGSAVSTIERFVLHTRGKRQLVQTALFRRLNFDRAAALIIGSFRIIQAKNVLRTLREDQNYIFAFAATLIQSVTRMYRVKLTSQLNARTILSVKFRRLLEAAVVVQKVWRGVVAQVDYSAVRIAVWTLQAFARAAICVRSYAVKRSSCVALQSFARKSSKRCAYRRTIEAVVRIQSSYRSFTAQIERHLRALCVGKLQAVARMFLAAFIMRRRVRDVERAAGEAYGNMVRVNTGVTRLQSYARMRGSARVFAKVRKNCVDVQRFARGWNARRDAVDRNLAAREVQRVYRSYRKTMRWNASTVISAYTRRHQTLQTYTKLRTRAILVQTYTRMHLTRLEYKSKLSAVLTLQSLTRTLLKRLEYALYKFAANEVAKTWRMFHARVKYCSCISGVGKVQTVARGVLARVKYVNTINSVIKIQSYTRMRTSQHKYKSIQTSSTTIQAFLRGTNTRNNINLQRYRYRYAACEIQRVWRGCKCEVDFIMTLIAVVKIQSVFRMVVGKVVCGDLKMKVFLKRVRDEEVRDLELLEFAACEVQKVVRGFLTRVGYWRDVRNVVRVQALVRCIIQTRVYRDVAMSVVVMQKVARGVSCRKYTDNVKLERTASTLVSITRRSSAKVLQRNTREMIRRSQIKRKINSLQRFARGYLGRVRSSLRTSLITTVQSLYRGNLARAQTSKKMRVIRLRLHLASATALTTPSLRLGVRTRTALDLLVKSRRLAEIMRAVQTLEVTSRYSEACCEAFAAAEAPRVLFALIRTLNRSLPHIELLTLVLMVVRNVGRYGHLVGFISCLEGQGVIVILVDLIQMFRDKEGVVVLCGELIIRLCSCSSSSSTSPSSSSSLSSSSSSAAKNNNTNENDENKCLKKIREAENAKRLQGILGICYRKAGGKVGGKKGAGILVLERLEKLLK